LALEQDQVLEVGIFDVTGRRVHTLAKGLFTAGDRELVWDGRDSAGRQLPAGVYFASVSSAKGKSEGTKLLMLK
jgi:flagellar hook assembly protein FlgD